MRTFGAPGSKRVPFSEVAERDVQAGMHTAIDDCLQRGFHLAWCDDLFYDIAAVVVISSMPGRRRKAACQAAMLT